MQKIYLIQHISIDNLENRFSDALGWYIIGFRNNLDDALRIREQKGFYVGTGWPIKEGFKMPCIRIIKVMHSLSYPPNLKTKIIDEYLYQIGFEG